MVGRRGSVVRLLVLLVVVASARFAAAQLVAVPFESERWVLAGGRMAEHLGRAALAGGATLAEVEFLDGTVEVDVAVTGSTSYPGIDFRVQPGGDGENVYLRPHRISRYGDSVQYAPKSGAGSSWQLYSGDGYTAGFDVPAGKWVTFRLEVLGDRARVFIGEAALPVLTIDHLQGPRRPGGLALSAPQDGSAYFSNFRYSPEPPVGFGPPAWQDRAPGIVAEWQVSQVLPAELADADELPGAEVLERLSWQRAEAAPTGLVDLSKHAARTGMRPDAVLARTTIHSDRRCVRPLDLGYSDHVAVWLNGQPVFRGRSAYQERDPSFLGIVGPFDTVYLSLEEGDNQLVLKVTEAFGGWGLLARWGDASERAPGVVPAWVAAAGFKIPESVAWDPTRELLYVSNYDGYNPSRGEGLQSIARVSLDGTTVDPGWVAGLRNPTGLAVHGDSLWVAERGGLAEVNIPSAGVAHRYELPAPGFPNDVAVDARGQVYLSDSRRGVIYRLRDGRLEPWLDGIGLPNGLHAVGNELLIGLNSDHSIRAADLETGALRTVARLGPGAIDGIGSDASGNILVSHWEGRVLRITPDGEVSKLLDTSVLEEQCADLTYVAERDLLVVPTYLDGRVLAFRIAGGPRHGG